MQSLDRPKPCTEPLTLPDHRSSTPTRQPLIQSGLPSPSIISRSSDLISDYLLASSLICSTFQYVSLVCYCRSLARQLRSACSHLTLLSSCKSDVLDSREHRVLLFSSFRSGSRRVVSTLQSQTTPRSESELNKCKKSPVLSGHCTSPLRLPLRPWVLLSSCSKYS